MKILFLAGWFPQGDDFKGIFIKEHALALAGKHQVCVIHGNENQEQKEKFRFHFSIEDNLQVMRFTFREIPFFPSYPRYVKGTINAFEKLLAHGFKPDIVHAHIYHTGVPANIIRKKYNIPYVITEQFTGFPRKIMRKSKVKKARIGMENASYILPVSNSLKKAIIDYGITGNFEIVPNTVPDTFCYAPELRNKAGIKRILCVAAMHPKKNIPNLINACRILRDIRQDFNVDIVGVGEKMEEYKQLVSRAGLGNTILFLGSRSKKEIVFLMQSSEFFVLPSKYDNLPCVLIESIACGLPVVSTKAGGIPEIIDESNGILVESDNPQELSEAMTMMLNNPDRYDRKGISLNAHKKYSYGTVEGQLTRLYEKALARHKEENIH